jgi:aminodeoxyfutalosine deaminase
MAVPETPLAELHLHLEGSIDPQTLREIDPALTLEEIARETSYADFAGFIRAYVWVNRKLKSPQHYAIIARRLFESLDAQGIAYAEITVSAGVVLWKQQDLASVFDALAREAARARSTIRWILDATRQWGADAARPVFDFAAEHQGDGVVAIGIGGIEAEGPALWFRDVYARARDRGLRLTAHAGETTGPESVWDAIEIGAERIGHGIRSIQDPLLVAYLRDHDIPVEICITSNLRTGAVPSLEEHPVKRLFDAGVPILLSTDDPALFECTLQGEYALAQRQFGFTPEQLAAISENARRYAFAEAD